MTTGSADAVVGMMDTAYFVGRAQLLEFFNNLLALELTKIEQTATGAVACQLTEYIFPGSIPMSRVNWEAKSDYEFINNYKLLQVAFSKHRVQRHVDVNKLIRGKYQDNLEFCQWLKAFYDQSGVVREDYDPKAVRAKGKGGQKYNESLAKSPSKYGSKPLPGPRNPRRVTPAPTPASKSPPGPTPRPALRANPVRPAAAVKKTTPPNKKLPLRASENNKREPPKAEKVTVDIQLTKKNTELEARITKLETNVLELEKERDFYFGKLRNVELMLQVQQDKNFEGLDLEAVVGSIFKILYATAEEEVVVNDDGEIVPIVPPKVDVSGDLSAALASEVGDVSAEDNLLAEVDPSFG